MIDFIYGIILGIIQGLTEFWPISSSGHLVVAHNILNFDFADNLSFDVALHIGTLIALVIYFWRDIRRYIVAFVRSLANFRVRDDVDQRLAWLIVIGTVPAGLVGYFLGDTIEGALRAIWVVGVTLIVVGLLFFLAERYARRERTLEQLGWKGALAIGTAQAVALIPGVSRSGSTILAGMSIGLPRHTAARFSFLLSIPIVFGAGLQKMVDAAQKGIGREEWLVMLAGLVTSAIVGYIAIRVLLKFLSNHSLNVFGYYRIALGVVLLLYYFLQ